VLGGALGYSAWKLMPTKFESAATLQVKIQDPHVLYHGEGVEFEAYKRNLVAAIKTSSLVIQKVLDSKAVQNVPVIKEHGLDAGAWLSDNLTVDDQLGSEYVKVALRYEDPHGLPDIVNALVNAYMSGVLDTERTDKLRRRDELDKKYRTYKQNVLDKERQLFELNQQIGTADAETAKIKYRIEVADLEGLMQSRAEAQKQIAELTMKIEMAKQMYADAQKGDVSDAQIEELIARDPQILQANNDLALLHRQERELSKVVKNSARSPEMVRIRDTISSVEQSIEEFRTADRQRLIESIRRNGAEGGANMKALELERQLYVDQFKHSTQDVATQAENVQKLEKFNGDADQLRTDITQLQTVVNEMSNTLTQWNIELDAPPRVTLQSEASAVRAVDPYKQYGMAGFGGFLGFGLALAAATFYEFFSRRVNSANDVAEGLGIRVMGDLPALRRRRIALRARSRRAIHGLVAESINSIRAALVRNSEPGACNVYLVSSAVDQEGKTTVASQLAASLARSGRRTLLLDGDLRHPGAHHVFGLTNEYGFSEMLRGEVHVDDAIRPTPADNLWMITAGQACAQAVLMLGKDALGEIFSRLEARFDFIVVDSGPVLKVADPMLLGQFVDGAILSTLRDVSQIHKVYEASERLKLAGVKVVGAVVNGVDEHSAYDRYNVELPAA
jgi:capsular exopolysaccharide synthesis family protein